MLIQWLIFLHILGAITFFLGHGASAAMVFRLRHETELERIRAMLDLSASTMMVYFVAFLVMGLTGLILPFLIGLWGETWIWLSIVLMVFVAGYMSWFNRKTYNVVREMAGMPYMAGNKPAEAKEPVAVEEIVAFVRGIRLHGLVVVGYVVPGFVLWMMVFKPF